MTYESDATTDVEQWCPECSVPVEDCQCVYGHSSDDGGFEERYEHLRPQS